MNRDGIASQSAPQWKPYLRLFFLLLFSYWHSIALIVSLFLYRCYISFILPYSFIVLAVQK